MIPEITPHADSPTLPDVGQGDVLSWALAAIAHGWQRRLSAAGLAAHFSRFALLAYGLRSATQTADSDMKQPVPALQAVKPTGWLVQPYIPLHVLPLRRTCEAKSLHAKTPFSSDSDAC
jgi:hypothetical protein